MPGSDPVPIPVAAVVRLGCDADIVTSSNASPARGCPGPGPYDSNLLSAAAKDIQDRAREP